MLFKEYTGSLIVHEKTLLKKLKLIFPNHIIHENTRKQSALRYASTNAFMEFDIWIPSLNLCFEFQDNYHYETTWYFQKSLAYVRNKDEMKAEAVRYAQVPDDLLVVPVWWSPDELSLQATISFYRPDLFDYSTALPIPLNPPYHFFKATHIPDVTELMLASFPPDPSNFLSSLKRHTWWIGEKYDGVRCCWNPKLQQLYTRHGRTLQLLPAISYPPMFIDGELWFGRGQFSLAYTLQSQAGSPWQSLRLLAFDVPCTLLSRSPFEERYAALLVSVPCDDPTTVNAVRTASESAAHVAQALAQQLRTGGEGLVLRSALSRYERGRSGCLLKLKSSQRDTEAVVLQKHANKSVSLKLPSGKKIYVAAEYVHVPQLATGDVVTVAYEVHARRDIPVSPSVVRVRTDLSWADVVLTYQHDHRYLNDNSLIQGVESKPMSPAALKQMRLFLEKFAKNRQLDPLLSETWYRTPVGALKNKKGGKKILKKFKGKGRYFVMLQTVFPEIGLQKEKFGKVNAHDVRDRREYFEKYARTKGFDPQHLNSWTVHSARSMVAEQGGGTFVGGVKGGFYKALELAFPEIGMSDFHQYSWKSAGNRRKFFEVFAMANQFDPLIAHHWYDVQRLQFLDTRGAGSILLYHRNSLSQALLDLFPDIGLEANLLPCNAWGQPENRRRFFEQYAEFNHFDPEVPNNWYLQPRSKILSFPRSRGVLSYHNNRVSQALLDLFPNIGLDEAKLRPWQDASTRRKFFEEYAIQNNFDPLNPVNWYQQPAYRIFALKYSRRIMAYHGNSIKVALLDLFPEIGLDGVHFDFWNKEDANTFFLNYAKLHGFDPFVPENWYRQLLSNILSMKGSRKIRQNSSNNMATALLKAYPSIGLQRSKLSHMETSARESKHGSWKDKNKRRKFFEDFALAHSFDSLIPNNWYLITHKQIASMRGSGAVLYYYNKSIPKALCDLFPDIGLELSSFPPSTTKTPAKRH